MYLLSHTNVYWENDFTVNACIQSTVTSATVSVICQCDQLCYFVIQVFFDTRQQRTSISCKLTSLIFFMNFCMEKWAVYKVLFVGQIICCKDLVFTLIYLFFLVFFPSFLDKHVISVSRYFELIRCCLCGSRGTHRKCSELKLDIKDWACSECTGATDGKGSANTESQKNVRVW